MPTPPILVYEYLCAGGRLTGLSITEQDDLRRQGSAMRDAMLDDLAAIPGLHAEAWQGAGDHASALRDAAARGQLVWAVAPESDGVLEHLARAVPSSHWLGCQPDTIALATSKQATTAHLARHGIAVPSTEARNATGRWIVKPDDGAGATETRVHEHHAAALADAGTRPGRCTVEPWIEGEPLSLSLCCSAGRAELLAINRQHIRIDAEGSLHFDGVSAAAISPDSDAGRAVQPLVPALARALPGLRGYVGIDLVLTAQGHPVVIEVNPRLTSAYVGLSARLGFNVAQRLLTALVG